MVRSTDTGDDRIQEGGGHIFTVNTVVEEVKQIKR